MPDLPDITDFKDYEELEARFIAKQVIKVEMTKLGFGYRELASALAKIGVVEEEKNLRNKIARGTYSAAFLITCMAAMKVKHIDLGPWMKSMEDTFGEVRDLLAERAENKQGG